MFRVLEVSKLDLDAQLSAESWLVPDWSLG